MIGDPDTIEYRPTAEVHPKVWGEEHWIVNHHYCGKLLKLEQGRRCSMHFHILKDETFYVVSGAVLMEINGQARVMRRGDVQHVQPGDRHRFTGLTHAEIIEFSTHHLEEDSYRETTSGEVPAEEFRALRQTYLMA